MNEKKNLNGHFPKVTIVGAGNVGATAAQLLLSKNIADVVLLDVSEGLAQGKALDLMQMRCNEQFRPEVSGGQDYAASVDSDVVVITAGIPRRPGMTREELISVNASIVSNVLDGSLPASPDAVYILVTNPLDVMTNLVGQLSGLPSSRLMGMGGVLDSARFAYAISQATGVQPPDIQAMVIGAHGEAMVPLPSLAKVSGHPLTSVLTNPNEPLPQLTQDTGRGGALIVELLQSGSAFYAPASAIARMVQAILDDEHELLSACAKLTGQYGISDLYMGVPVLLGSAGVEQVVELPLAPSELELLQRSAQAIREQLALNSNILLPSNA